MGRRFLVSSLPLLPALALYAVAFVAPLLFLVYTSTQRFSAVHGIYGGWSTGTYRSVLGASDIGQVVFRTVWTAFVVVVISLVIGMGVAILFRFGSSVTRLIIMLGVIGPLLISSVVRTFGWVLFFGPGGIFEHVTGLKLLNTSIANIVGLVNLFVALVVLAVLPSLSRIQQSEVDAAATLGLSKIGIVCRVIVPMAVPGMISGGVIVFGAASGAVISPFLLGGSTFGVLPVRVFSEALELANPPAAAAFAILLVCVSLVVVVTFEKGVRSLWLKWDR